MVHYLSDPLRYVHGSQWVPSPLWDLRLHPQWLLSPPHLHLKETRFFEGEGEEEVAVVSETKGSWERF